MVETRTYNSNEYLLVVTLDSLAQYRQSQKGSEEMTTYLFIWAVMAGATATNGSANYQTANWKGQWTTSVKFERPESCHKAAANLGLKKEEYRCIDISGGVR